MILLRKMPFKRGFTFCAGYVILAKHEQTDAQIRDNSNPVLVSGDNRKIFEIRKEKSNDFKGKEDSDHERVCQNPR